MTDPEIIEIERVANTLRGMTLDRRIPDEPRRVLMCLAEALDAITESALSDEDDEL